MDHPLFSIIFEYHHISISKLWTGENVNAKRYNYGNILKHKKTDTHIHIHMSRPYAYLELKCMHFSVCNHLQNWHLYNRIPHHHRPGREQLDCDRNIEHLCNGFWLSYCAF